MRQLPVILLLGILSLGRTHAGTLEITATDADGATVSDAVILIRSIDGQVPPSTPLDVIVDQVDETFVPHVRAATVGSRVTFPNSDHVRHHVYSFSDAKAFELPLYIGLEAAPIVFDKAGVVTLGCNIHDHMLGYILIVDTPYFAEVVDGHAALTDIPGGELQVELWHPRLAAGSDVVRTLTLAADGTVSAEFSVTLDPPPMMRRAPRRSGTRY